MRSRNDLIPILRAAVEARATGPGGLRLPDCGMEDWQRLLSGALVVELGPGDILLRRDEQSNDLCFLVEGELEVSVPQADSQTLTAPVAVRPGSVVGEIAFFDSGPRTASVWSRDRSVVLRLPEAGFHAWRAAEPARAAELLFALARIVASRLRRHLGAARRDAAAY
jgi:CRP-like cAMP-binding protein